MNYCRSHVILCSKIKAPIKRKTFALILGTGFALIIVVLITGIFSFIQENKETDVRKEFDRLIPEKATVIRFAVFAWCFFLK